MATRSGSFTVNAWLIGHRWQHHRQHDHFGAESDAFIMLSQKIGIYEEQTSVHAVLADLVNRIYILETSTRTRGNFTLNAWFSRATVTKPFQLDAVTRRASTHTFLLDAWKVGGGKFTLNAVIRGGGRFTLNAMVV